MPRNRFIRFFTGDSLASKMSEEEFRKSNPSLFDLAKFHESSLTESMAKSAYDPGELQNTLGREGSYRIKPLKGKPFFLLDIPVAERKKKLQELSNNPAVIEQLFNILSTGAGLEIDSLNEGLVKNTSPILVAQHSKALNFQTIQCETDGSILVTSTTGRKIACVGNEDGGNGGVVLPDDLNFYITTITLRVSPKTVKVGEPEEATITVEHVKEEINLGVLEDKKNNYQQELGEKKYKDVLKTKSSLLQSQRQKKIDVSLKNKALYIHAYQALENYTEVNKFKDITFFDDIKEHISGKFDENKFKEGISNLELCKNEEISELLKEFTILQLTKTKAEILRIYSVEKPQKVLEQIDKVLTSPTTNKDIRSVNDYIIDIKKCLSWSYFSGANLSFFFSRNHELKEIISEFGEIFMANVTSSAQSVIKESKYFPIVKNALLNFFNSYELCELYKKLTKLEISITTDETKDADLSNKIDVIKKIICFILEERKIETTYYIPKGRETTPSQAPVPVPSNSGHSPTHNSF